MPTGLIRESVGQLKIGLLEGVWCTYGAQAGVTHSEESHRKPSVFAVFTINSALLFAVFHFQRQVEGLVPVMGVLVQIQSRAPYITAPPRGVRRGVVLFLLAACCGTTGARLAAPFSA